MISLNNQSHSSELLQALQKIKDNQITSLDVDESGDRDPITGLSRPLLDARYPVELCCALEKNLSVRDLRLTRMSNPFDKSLINLFTKSAPFNLTSLSFSECALGAPLMESLLSISSLRSLTYKGDRWSFNPNSFNALLHTNRLTSLSLNHCVISESTINIMYEALIKATNLTSLNLSNAASSSEQNINPNYLNRISLICISRLVDLATQNSSLTELDISKSSDCYADRTDGLERSCQAGQSWRSANNTLQQQISRNRSRYKAPVLPQEIKKMSHSLISFLEGHRKTLSAASSSSSAQQIAPKHFECPISLLLMADPVMAADGNTYEREQIEKWLSEKNTSPTTGLEVPHKMVIPNNALRSGIHDFLESKANLWHSSGMYLPIQWINDCLSALKEGNIQDLSRSFERHPGLLTRVVGHNGDTFFDWAVMYANVATLEFFIQRLERYRAGYVAEMIFSYMRTSRKHPLRLAYEHSRSAEVLSLLAKYCHPKISGFDPVHWSVILDDAEILSYCLKLQPTDIDKLTENDEGLTPLQLAVLLERRSIMNDLLKSGAKVNLVNRDGDSALHFAVIKDPINIDLVQTLIYWGARTKLRNSSYCTPLVRLEERVEQNVLIQLQTLRREYKDRLAEENRTLSRQVQMLSGQLEQLQLLVTRIIDSNSLSQGHATPSPISDQSQTVSVGLPLLPSSMLASIHPSTIALNPTIWSDEEEKRKQ